MLRDMGVRHTITCLRTRARRRKPGKLEGSRCTLVGSGRQALLVTQVIQTWMLIHHYIPVADGLSTLRARGAILCKFLPPTFTVTT